MLFDEKNEAMQYKGTFNATSIQISFLNHFPNLNL